MYGSNHFARGQLPTPITEKGRSGNVLVGFDSELGWTFVRAVAGSLVEFLAEAELEELLLARVWIPLLLWFDVLVGTAVSIRLCDVSPLSVGDVAFFSV